MALHWWIDYATKLLHVIRLLFKSILFEQGYVISFKANTWINVKYVICTSSYMKVFTKIPNFDKEFTILLDISLVYVKRSHTGILWSGRR